MKNFRFKTGDVVLIDSSKLKSMRSQVGVVHGKTLELLFKEMPENLKDSYFFVIDGFSVRNKNIQNYFSFGGLSNWEISYSSVTFNARDGLNGSNCPYVAGDGNQVNNLIKPFLEQIVSEWKQGKTPTPILFK